MTLKTKHFKDLFALDLGTTKFCLATLRERPNASSPWNVEHISVPADGMRRGMLANMDQARVALTALLEQAERHFGTDINRVVVGIAGSHLRGRTVTATRPIAGETASLADMQALLVSVEKEQASETRELLHAVPLGYRIDDRPTVEDPTGFRGTMLSADYFLIDADKLYLKDVVDVCNDCGLQVVKLYSEPFASASVTVPDSYKQLGIAMADIGGGTTDGIVFQKGHPIGIFTVNIAGKLMTSDLSVGLNVCEEEAEKVKIRFGIKPRAGDTIEIRDVRGATRVVGAREINPVLLPRIHELGSQIARNLLPYRGALGAGLLLTGGGADAKGITEYFQYKMGIPVMRARPVLSAGAGKGIAETSAPFQSLHSTKLATVIGLINLEIGRLGELDRNSRNNWTSRYLGPLLNWLKELS